MWTADLLCIVWWCLATLDQLVAVYLKPKFTAVSWFDWDHAAAIIGSIVVHTVDDIMQKWSLIQKSEYFQKANFNPKCSFFNTKILHLLWILPLLRTCSPQTVSGGPEPCSSCVTILTTTARILHNSDVIPVLWIFVSFQRVCRYPSQSMEICLSQT